MRNPRAGRLVALAASLLAFALTAPSLAQAQDAVIKGTVTGPQGEPVEGAQISVQTMLLGAATDAKGQYTFTVSASNVKGQTVNLVARRLGFAAVTKQVVLSAGEHAVDFAMKQDVRRLDEVVVTGVAGATEMKNTTISISKVNEDQIKEVPAQDIGTLLTGKVAGVQVLSETGLPGASATVQIRGSTVLQVGNSSPTYIIDGVVSKNGISSIDPQDIVSMEVLKGAASATTYGSQGANGVIAVTTRRGKNLADGKMQFTFRSEFGKSDIEHYPPLATTHIFDVDANGNIVADENGIRQEKADHFMDAPYPTRQQNPTAYYRNQLQTWLQSNTLTNNYLTLGYRKGNTNFMASFSRMSDPGIMPILSGFKRQNFRFNLDQGVTDKLDVSASMMYGTTTSDQGQVNGADDFFGLLQAPPDIDLAHPPVAPNHPETDSVLYANDIFKPVDPQQRGNPLYDLLHTNNNDQSERIFGAFTARYRPISWLAFDATYGTDRFNRLNSTYQFKGYLNTDGIPQTGFLRYGTDRDHANNAAINGTLTYGLSALKATTKLTYLYDDEREDVVNTNGNQFKLREIQTLNAIDPAQFTANSSIINTRSRQYLVNQGLNWKDTYLAQATYVHDESSLFGSAARNNDFYQVSGAWRVTQNFKIPGIQELKLRAANGTAGLRPGFEYQFETYGVSNGQYSKNTLGNNDLQPAIQHETEVGVDASFLNRFDLDLVRSERKTNNAFLQVPLSIARAGGFQYKWQNAATITGKTWELALTTRVIQQPNFSYNFTLTGEHTRQHIDRLDAPPFQQNPDGSQGQGIFYYRQGEDLGVIYGNKFVTDYSQLLDNPANAGMTLADIQALYTKNADGYVVLAANKGTPAEAPIIYVDKSGKNKVVIGNVNPDYTFGWANTIRVKNFTIYALVNGTQGGDVYNFTKQWMFFDLRSGDEDQSGRKQSDKIAIDYYANGIYNLLNPDSYFVEDGSFVKLREVSVNYQFSNALLKQIGLGNFVRSLKVALIGRNLKTWTKYSGFDPEAGAGGDANFRIDGFRYPAFRTFSGQIEIGF
ncbi:MAG TPA: SusC/RagA family TonB-linked outer membrane protein [Gemmatimonadaceae bacterium]|nr:SusC/RagA family TonB-linked outer membrane protein [Gemmatimonadaceae bacterium]